MDKKVYNLLSIIGVQTAGRSDTGTAGQNLGANAGVHVTWTD